MPNLVNVTRLGSQVVVLFDDGTKQIGYPTAGGMYLFAPNLNSPDSSGTSESGSSTGTPSADPTSPDGIYNPWAALSISGTWASHMSYSLGGVDYPLGYGTGIKAPAAGTLRSVQTSGLSDQDTGWVGSAGRRSILVLDAEFPRVRAAESGENSGNLHSIVFQHQSVLGTNGKHYDKGMILGKSGASANKQDYGGDTHLHVHGLNAAGQRLNLLNFIP